MKAVLLDIWHDLKEKRLWSVAVALIVGVVAVPLALSKSSEGGPAAPAPSPAPSATGPKDQRALASVRLATTDRDSDLGTFDSNDPFRPPGAAAEAAETAGSVTPSTGGDALVPSPSTSSPASGDGGSGAGVSPSVPPVDGSPGSPMPTPARPKPVRYRLVADVTFQGNGRTRKVKGMALGDMLPHRESPLLVFLGAAPKGGNAVFLVDSELQTDGEGKCRPRPKKCDFLFIQPGAEQMFTNKDGDSFLLRVRDIRQVMVKDEPSPSKDGSDVKKKKSLDASSAGRRFSAPVLTDRVSR